MSAHKVHIGQMFVRRQIWNKPPQMVQIWTLDCNGCEWEAEAETARCARNWAELHEMDGRVDLGPTIH